jgi:hypothetical protein
MKISRRAAAAAVVGLILVGGIGSRLLHPGSNSDATQTFHLRTPPVEFLYLDSPRLLNYQIQLEGGRAGAVHRIAKAIDSVSGDVGTGDLKIGASAQREDTVESTLSPAASSELGVMLRDLREDTWAGVSIHDVNLNSRRKLRTLREGWLVRFKTRDLLSPGYIRPYVVVRQSATLAALFPHEPGDPVTEQRAEEQRSLAQGFAKQIGPNPRITFAVAPPVREDGSAVKVLLPMQYADLTRERSMLEKGPSHYTGGGLTVVGKVIRVFPGREIARRPRRCPPREPSCEKQRSPAYVDYATREIWKSPLKEASNYLINQVSHNCRAPWGTHERHPLGKEYMAGRHCFLARLRRQTRLAPPGMVVLPLAIYK